jgi:hypothetical protein
MPRKPAPPPDDPEQSKRFIDMARAVEAEGTDEEFSRAFKKIISHKGSKRKETKP